MTIGISKEDKQRVGMMLLRIAQHAATYHADMAEAARLRDDAKEQHYHSAQFRANIKNSSILRMRYQLPAH
jgi:hypothetical protein